MTYYKTDSRKISFGEYWNLTKGPSCVVAWVFKIFGLPLPLAAGLPGQQPFRAMIVDHASLPSEVMGKFSPLIAELQKLGFHQFWFTTVNTSLLGDAAYGLQGVHPSGQVMTKLAYARIRTFESLVVGFITEFENGNFLATTNKKKDLRSPSGYEIQRRRGATIQELWRLHESALAKSSPLVPKLVLNFEQLDVLENKTMSRLYEDRIARGVWVPMTPEEIEALKRKRQRT